MASSHDHEEDAYDHGAPVPLTLRIKEVFWPPPAPKPGPEDRIPTEQRKEVMRSLDPQEIKLSVAAFVLAIVGGIAIPAIIIATNKTTKAGKHSFADAPSAILFGGVVVVLCVLGFIALWKRKRTFVAFDLLLIGFALYTLIPGPILFVFVFLGGWLMLRAWRINRYGTTDAKAIRQEAASRPRGKAAASSSKSTATGKGKASQPGVRKPPTASKRYTPKSPPRKKIPKPTQ